VQWSSSLPTHAVMILGDSPLFASVELPAPRPPRLGAPARPAPVATVFHVAHQGDRRIRWRQPVGELVGGKAGMCVDTLTPKVGIALHVG
jgi:hypothetical protein